MPVQSQSSLDWSPTRSPHDVELVTCGWRRSRLDEKESALTLRREEDAVQRRLQVGGVVCSGDSDEEKGAVGDAQKTQHAVLVVRLRLWSKACARPERSLTCHPQSTCGRRLKWNLDGERPLEFGALVSSSNELSEALVTVDTSAPLLWTVGLRE